MFASNVSHSSTPDNRPAKHGLPRLHAIALAHYQLVVANGLIFRYSIPIMKIIDSTIVHKSKFVTLAAVTYEDRRGNTKNWYMARAGVKHPNASIEVSMDEHAR